MDQYNGASNPKDGPATEALLRWPRCDVASGAAESGDGLPGAFEPTGDAPATTRALFPYSRKRYPLMKARRSGLITSALTVAFEPAAKTGALTADAAGTPAAPASISRRDTVERDAFDWLKSYCAVSRRILAISAALR